jgi:hypothetical protein
MSDPKRRQSLIQRLRDLFRRRKPLPPGDFDAERLVPVRRGPKGRSGAAVTEPDEESYGFFPPRRP